MSNFSCKIDDKNTGGFYAVRMNIFSCIFFAGKHNACFAVVRLEETDDYIARCNADPKFLRQEVFKHIRGCADTIAIRISDDEDGDEPADFSKIADGAEMIDNAVKAYAAHLAQVAA